MPDQNVMATITITPEAQQAYTEAMVLIQDAVKWAESAGEVMELTKRRDAVRFMERTFYTSFLQLMFTRQNWDGPLQIMRDSPGSFFWKYDKSGYHGGFLFHPNYENGKPMPVGTWSMHT